jgi:hypothetical protein
MLNIDDLRDENFWIAGLYILYIQMAFGKPKSPVIKFTDEEFTDLAKQIARICTNVITSHKGKK